MFDAVKVIRVGPAVPLRVRCCHSSVWAPVVELVGLLQTAQYLPAAATMSAVKPLDPAPVASTIEEDMAPVLSVRLPKRNLLAFLKMTKAVSAPSQVLASTLPTYPVVAEDALPPRYRKKVMAFPQLTNPATAPVAEPVASAGPQLQLLTTVTGALKEPTACAGTTTAKSNVRAPATTVPQRRTFIGFPL